MHAPPRSIETTPRRMPTRTPSLVRLRASRRHPSREVEPPREFLVIRASLHRGRGSRAHPPNPGRRRGGRPVSRRRRRSLRRRVVLVAEDEPRGASARRARAVRSGSRAAVVGSIRPAVRVRVRRRSPLGRRRRRRRLPLRADVARLRRRVSVRQQMVRRGVVVVLGAADPPQSPAVQPAASNDSRRF